MEITDKYGSLIRTIQFKIDLIVWKLYQDKQSISRGEMFKIDLIVWKWRE